MRLHNSLKPFERTSDTVLVLGDGRSMRDDRDEFLSWGIEADVACIGRCIKEFPGRVHHWFNADGDSAIHWAKNLINGEGTIRHTFGEIDGFDWDWDIEQDDYHHAEMTGEKALRTHGSSSLFSAMACLEIGYQKVVLGGCPLDFEGHWYFPQGPETYGPIWLGYDFAAWLDFAATDEADRVRSMSGYTRKILGKATRGWVNAL